jgi:D-alanyl-D-alanine carboxypeptidase
VQKILTLTTIILIFFTLSFLYLYKISLPKEVKATISVVSTSTESSFSPTSTSNMEDIPVVVNEAPKICEADCSLYPVNKVNALSEKYIPTNLTSIAFSKSDKLSKEAADALNTLFLDANNKKINIRVISAYRSFNTQRATFNNWVNGELKKGKSRSEAELSANTYSAKEGHSEHQLGTTVDLACSTCTSFDNSKNNLALYKYIEENAYKYGFAISYYKNSESLTGYIYEPWHIRYIGKDLAEEFFLRDYLSQNEEYLSKFLSEKWLLR